MPAAQRSKELRSLCHEHHVEMRLSLGLRKNGGRAKPALAYACTEPGCLVHYNVSRGYFLLSENRGTNGLDMVPRVRCSQDGTPMYLAEIGQEKRGFRLWRCPKCDARRTNEESLIG
jgi:hypothetical protein